MRQRNVKYAEEQRFKWDINDIIVDESNENKDEDALLAHLKGKHDQSKHAHGGVDYPLGSEVNDADVKADVAGFSPSLRRQYKDQIQAKDEVFNSEDYAQDVAAAHNEFMTSVDGAIAVQVTPAALTGIITDGRFKTQHEVKPKTEQSTYEPHTRKQYEKTFMGVPTDTDVTRRPVYGYVGRSVDVSGYGPIKMDLQDHLRERTTVTYGDSLNGVLNPIKLNDVKSVSKSRREKAIDPGAIGEQTYTEVQIHGGVKLSDVKRVHIPKNLSDKFKKQLEDLDIEVIVT